MSLEEEELTPQADPKSSLDVAKALEKRHANDLRPHAAFIASYYVEAIPIIGPYKALYYLQLAGEWELGVPDYETAMGYFRDGLSLKEGQPMDSATAALLFGLAQAQAATLQRDQIGEATGNLNRAFDYYFEAGDVDQAVSVAKVPLRPIPGVFTGRAQRVERALTLIPDDSIDAGWLLYRHALLSTLEEGRYDDAAGNLGLARSIAQRESDSTLELQVLTHWSSVDFYACRWQGGFEKATQAVALISRVNDPGSEVFASYFASISAASMGEHAATKQYAKHALGVAERLQDNFWRATALWANEIAAYLAGDWSAAREFSDRTLAFWERDPRHWATRTLLETTVGELSQCGVYLERLVGLMEHPEQTTAMEYALPAMIIPAVGRVTGAVEYLGAARKAAGVVLDGPAAPFPKLYASVGLALLTVQHGQTELGDVAEQYEGLRANQGSMTLVGTVDRVLGLLSVAMGRMDQAMGHFAAAITFCREAGYWPEYAWTCYDYADALLQRGKRGDHTTACGLLDEGLAITRELGMLPLKERGEALRESKEAYPDGLNTLDVKVLLHRSFGNTPKEIGEELHFATITIYNHLDDICDKTGVKKNPYAMAIYAHEHGLAL